MKIEIEVDDHLFKICKKYRIESSIMFDKIAYLKLIKSNMDVKLDTSLLSLIEVLIADKLVEISGNFYKVTKRGELFLSEISVNTSESIGKQKKEVEEIPKEIIEKEEIIENVQEGVQDPLETFLNKYLKLWKDPETNKFYRAPAGITFRPLGASRRNLKKAFENFFKYYEEEFNKKIVENKKKGKMASLFTIQDLILSCTHQYVSDFKKDNFNYCKRADYFIIKYNMDKTFTSVLAEQCEEYLDNPPSQEQFNFNFFEKLSL